MIKHNLIIIFVVLTTIIYPATSISRWFSSSYADLTFTLRRYGHCIGDLPALKDNLFNETDYLINKMKAFLDQANYDIEQLANITQLMDNICRTDSETYAISVNIDVDKYNNSKVGKQFRCQAIDEALDSMYNVFKRASYNKSEPLDFSTIQFYPQQATQLNNRANGLSTPTPTTTTTNGNSYNLTDLINTSWIKSDTQLEHVCNITNSIKDYVNIRVNNLTHQAQDRADKQKQEQKYSLGPFGSLLDLIDRLILEPFFGFQKRLYWESSNTYEYVYSGISNQFDNFGKGFGNRLKSTRDRLSSIISRNYNNNTLINNSTIKGLNGVNNSTIVTNKTNLPQQTTTVISTTTTTITTVAPNALLSSSSTTINPATTTLPSSIGLNSTSTTNNNNNKISLPGNNLTSSSS